MKIDADRMMGSYYERAIYEIGDMVGAINVGVASETLKLKPRACLPHGIEDKPLVDALKDYMARHPERRLLT